MQVTIPREIPSMMRKRTKIVLGVVAAVVLLPVALVAAVFGWILYKDQTNGTLLSSGKPRKYLLYVPKSYDRSKASPLVISLHGAAGWPALQRDITRWNESADAHGFIVVYPGGSDLSGNGNSRGPRVWPMSPQSAEVDTKFIADLIDELEAKYNIDRARIYADGLSNGGGMAFVLSCKLSDRIAAVGAVAAAQSLPAAWCKDSHPVPMVAIHGTADPIVPYRGGLSGDRFKPVMFPDVRQWTADWARRNDCKGDPVESRVTSNVARLSYGNCAENADVVLYTVEGGGHAWPGGKALPEWWVGYTSHEIDATRVLWEFFERHPRASK